MAHVWVLAIHGGDGDIDVSVFASEKGAEDAFMIYFTAMFEGEYDLPTVYFEHKIDGWMDDWAENDRILYEITWQEVQ